MAGQETEHIAALLQENRVVEPSEEFRRNAVVQDEEVYREADQDMEGFWARQAERLRWSIRWDSVLEWDPPWVKWFTGGTLNVCENCVDRHVEEGKGDRVAFHWEGEPGETETLTYARLQEDVVRFANALRNVGVAKGTPVGIYMGMVPALPVAMLACARLGAPHTVVFGGFSAEALADRLNDMECEVLITQDEGWRRGQKVPLKRNADAALEKASTVKAVVVASRTGEDVPWTNGRDHLWTDLTPKQDEDPASCPPEQVDAEHLLYLLYTSGTTGKPKGIAHTTGGYLTGVSATHRMIFDLHPETDVYWCAADIGWVTGHSYIVYGPLANGATGILYEGAPDFPDKDRWWSIVEKYRATILYTAPTAIRTFMKWGPDWPEKHDMSSLRLLGSVGEPINPEAWVWYQTNIGGGRCPVVDTWWQTETGAIMISPLPGAIATKPGSATFPFPGVDADIVDNDGNSVGIPGGGYLVLEKPWPAMLRGIYGDPERYKPTYWSRFEGKYFAGDGAKRDEDGYFWLLGRVDDVMNISGHRISTTEVESALVDHPKVAEAAVCGANDPVTGQAIVAFVTVRGTVESTPALGEELRGHVAQKIGPTAKPKMIIFTDEL